MVIIEPRIAGVATDDLCNLDQVLQDTVRMGDNALLDHDQDPHDASHQEFVLLDLLRSWIPLDQTEDVLK